MTPICGDSDNFTYTGEICFITESDSSFCDGKVILYKSENFKSLGLQRILFISSCPVMPVKCDNSCVWSFGIQGRDI